MDKIDAVENDKSKKRLIAGGQGIFPVSRFFFLSFFSGSYFTFFFRIPLYMYIYTFEVRVRLAAAAEQVWLSQTGAVIDGDAGRDLCARRHGAAGGSPIGAGDRPRVPHSRRPNK